MARVPAVGVGDRFVLGLLASELGLVGGGRRISVCQDCRQGGGGMGGGGFCGMRQGMLTPVGSDGAPQFDLGADPGRGGRKIHLNLFILLSITKKEQ